MKRGKSSSGVSFCSIPTCFCMIKRPATGKYYITHLLVVVLTCMNDKNLVVVVTKHGAIHEAIQLNITFQHQTK